MSYKCNLCGEITLTPNHVCEQATQKMIDEIKKMGDPGRNTGMADILRKKITDLAVDLQEKERENNQLRAELTTCKSFHDVAVKERDAERREVDKLRTELAAERKKREEAEEQVELDTKMMDYRDKQIVNLEAQVEVLRDALSWLVKLKEIKDSGKTASYKRNKEKAWEHSRQVLANLPAKAEKVKAVLDAAGEQRLKYKQAQLHGTRDDLEGYKDACNTTEEAVREWGEGK